MKNTLGTRAEMRVSPRGLWGFSESVTNVSITTFQHGEIGVFLNLRNCSQKTKKKFTRFSSCSFF